MTDSLQVKEDVYKRESIYSPYKERFSKVMQELPVKQSIDVSRKEANDWVSGIRSYFRFVNNRRLDKRFTILPSLAIILTIVSVALLAPILAAVFLDIHYLKWVQEGYALKTGIFNQTTVLGDSIWILMLTGIALLTFSFFRANRFKGSKYVAWHRVFLNVYFVFTTVAFSGLIAVALKNIIGKARPEFVEGTGLWALFPFQDVYAFASFPSGHATTAGAMIAALWLLFPRWGWLLAPVGIWVAVSRMVIGVHFPSDVIAGFMLGILFTWIYARVFARKRLLFCFSNDGKLCLRGNKII